MQHPITKEPDINPHETQQWIAQLRDAGDFVLETARKAGVTAAQVSGHRSDALSHCLRHGELENIDRADSVALSITVFRSEQSATIAVDQLDREVLKDSIAKAVQMADVSPPDPHYTLAGAEELAQAQERAKQQTRDFDQFDPQPVAQATLEALARRLEESGLAVAGIKQSEGATAAFTRSASVLATSEGVSQAHAWTQYAFGLTLIAHKGDMMEVDGDGIARCHLQDLPDPEQFATTIADKAVAALGGTKLETGPYVIVLDHDMSRGFISTFLRAINGQAVVQGTSFLQSQLNQQIFPDTITITENPFLVRASRSRVFDSEGMACHAAAFITDGVLKRFIHTRETAARLQHEALGNGFGSAGRPTPAVTNVMVSPGKASFAQMLAPIKQGLYVTSQMGMGINLVTGDYSQGVSGFAIRDGQIAEPVREVTVAGHLSEMFRNMEVDHDICEKNGFHVPHICLGDMMVSGKNANS